MIKDIITVILGNKSDTTDIIKIGYIREVLQLEVLDFIYKNKIYKDLIFYGGTAMRFLLGLNRLSEDLDFIGTKFNDFEQLGLDLKNYFLEQKNIQLDYKLQKFRITLKFRNFLENFKIKFDNSTDLYLKIEISDHFDFCQNYKLKKYPINYQNKSMIINSLDESSLFATKLNAVLYRQWAKRNLHQDINVKGRDFYDFFWYIQKNISPNIGCIKGINNIKELKERLNETIKNTDFSHVVNDIKSFIEDKTMLDFIKTNGKEYLLEKINEWN